jgi:hypothetical protein
MSISQTVLDRSRKKLATLDYPTELEWAEAQPEIWRDACKVFAIASNTRGGVVGKSMAAMVSESNAAGVTMSLRTFKRHVAHLQAHGIVYQDALPVEWNLDAEDYRRQASTWLLRLCERMPETVKLSDTVVPRQRQSIDAWCKVRGIVDADSIVGRLQPAYVPF